MSTDNQEQQNNQQNPQIEDDSNEKQGMLPEIPGASCVKSGIVDLVPAEAQPIPDDPKQSLQKEDDLDAHATQYYYVDNTPCDKFREAKIEAQPQPAQPAEILSQTETQAAQTENLGSQQMPSCYFVVSTALDNAKNDQVSEQQFSERPPPEKVVYTGATPWEKFKKAKKKVAPDVAQPQQYDVISEPSKQQPSSPSRILPSRIIPKKKHFESPGAATPQLVAQKLRERRVYIETHEKQSEATQLNTQKLLIEQEEEEKLNTEMTRAVKIAQIKVSKQKVHQLYEQQVNLVPHEIQKNVPQSPSKVPGVIRSNRDKLKSQHPEIYYGKPGGNTRVKPMVVKTHFLCLDE